MRDCRCCPAHRLGPLTMMGLTTYSLVRILRDNCGKRWIFPIRFTIGKTQIANALSCRF
jgi:hypothetical protein